MRQRAHRTITPIPNLSGHADPVGQPLDVPAKSHPLNPPDNLNINRHKTRPFGSPSPLSPSHAKPYTKSTARPEAGPCFETLVADEFFLFALLLLGLGFFFFRKEFEHHRLGFLVEFGKDAVSLVEAAK